MGSVAILQMMLWAAGVITPLLLIAWVMDMGLTRGLAAGLCRIGWVAPLFLCLFPETTSEQLPKAMSLRPVQVLLDDSQSMTGAATATVKELTDRLEADCARLGCLPKVTRLSELSRETARGFTPLGAVIEPWLYKTGSDPWVVISDGGDAQPREAWPTGVKGTGKPRVSGEPHRGLIIGFKADERANIWIEKVGVSPFSFEAKPIAVDVQLSRSGKQRETERIQLQVMAEGQPLATVNATFKPEETHAAVTVTLPPLPRGQHLLTIKALPTADELALWDNTDYAQVEVLPNTVGVLHLLGSPSWDGRFLRRYLKSEPKYDLISFFILRDPWDSQQVNERELSLIPFPVERLFKEELPNFRVVVIQNFTLFQFLLPEYQENLVRFVQEGGGLLFVGGPRALQPSDLSNSPLSAILPFELDERASARSNSNPILDAMRSGFPSDQDDSGGEGEGNQDPHGPAYDEKQSFKIELAQPSPEKRALANVFDDWEQLRDELTSWDNARGLHHMERVKFKKDVTTTLLNARTPNGAEIPLAVASYPGKGRALWLFSDSLWRLAMSMKEDTSRQSYNRFLESAMTWLMRQEMRKSLVATRFILRGKGRMLESQDADGGATTAGGEPAPLGQWHVTLQGSALRYLQVGDATSSWQLKVCGLLIPFSEWSLRKTGSEEFVVSGALKGALAGGERCTLEIEAKHPAFGSVKTQITGVMPETYTDAEIGSAPQKLVELSQLTGAALSQPPDAPDEALGAWLERMTGQEGVALPNRFRTTQNYFWVLERPWFWLLMLLMPLEVIIRRWEQLVGGPSRRRQRHLSH